MNWKEYFSIGVVVALAVGGRHLVGNRFTLGVFMVLGAIGIALTLLHLRWRQAVAEIIRATGPTARERLLVHMENEAIRPALLSLSGVDAPPVPLRRDVERFSYPDSHLQSFTNLGLASIAFAVFLLILWVGERLQWWHIFARSASQGLYLTLLIVGFSLSGAVMLIFRRKLEGVLEVSADDLAWRRAVGATTRIPWTAVTFWEVGELADSITVHSRGERIAVDYNLEGFGRAVNLIATRIPGEIPSRTS